MYLEQCYGPSDTSDSCFMNFGVQQHTALLRILMSVAWVCKLVPLTCCYVRIQQTCGAIAIFKLSLHFSANCEYEIIIFLVSYHFYIALYFWCLGISSGTFFSYGDPFQVSCYINRVNEKVFNFFQFGIVELQHFEALFELVFVNSQTSYCRRSINLCFCPYISKQSKKFRKLEAICMRSNNTVPSLE